MLYSEVGGACSRRLPTAAWVVAADRAVRGRSGLLAAPVAEAFDSRCRRGLSCRTRRSGSAAASPGRSRSTGPAPRPPAASSARPSRAWTCPVTWSTTASPWPASWPRTRCTPWATWSTAAASSARSAVMPEFWLYLRGRGARTEVVCKIFDSEPGWSVDALEQPGKAPLEQVGGARAAGRRGPVRWPVGRSPDPRPPGGLEGGGQGRLVRAAGAAGRRERPLRPP